MFWFKGFFWIRGDTFGIFQTEKVLSALLYVTLFNQKDHVGNLCAAFVISLHVHQCVRLTMVFAFLSSSFSGTSCGLCLTRILRLLRLPFPLNPHHHHRQHHHCHDYHRSSSAEYQTKIFRRRCLAFFLSPLWRSATYKLLPHFCFFFSILILHVYVYIPLFI